MRMAKNSEAYHPVNCFIGNRLRSLRQKHRMSLSGLAGFMGLSYQQIQQYELGVCRMSAGMLYEFACIFKVPVTYFYEGLEERQRDIASSVPAVLETARNQPLTILLVENDAGDEVLTREALGQCGLPVTLYACRDGIEALQFLRKRQNGQRPDIILLDLHIPKKDGMTVLADIKHDRFLEDIPVIILTNSVNPEALFEAYKKHASGFVKKAPTLGQFAHDLSLIVTYWSSMVLPSMQKRVA